MSLSQKSSKVSKGGDHICPDSADDIRAFAEFQIARIQKLVKIGRALSAEKDHERLLGMIVDEAKRFTNADGCTLYLKSRDKKSLQFKVIRNNSLDIKMGGSEKDITWPPVRMYDEQGHENHRNVSSHCALTGEAINIEDVYHAEFDFQGTKDFDETTGYRSKSMLVLPMNNHENEIIGVIQLLNAMDVKTGEVVGFPDSEIGLITSLASQAAIAVTNIRLIEGLEELLHSIIKMIAAAIDEKSPCTAGHVARVAELTEHLSLAVNADDSERFAGTVFSDQELEEVRLAAWMHDVGKITTPEYVIDKGTKLETLFDRVELIRQRVALLKKDMEIAVLRQKLQGEGVGSASVNPVIDEFFQINQYQSLVESTNCGEEFLSDDNLEKVREFAKTEVELDGEMMPMISADELENLAVRKGTLNSKERQIINNHVSLTAKMLESLPFPEKLKNIPLFAGMHHEKLDGSGYPKGISGQDIPLQARIMVVADIFEALTAADRPYKKGKMLSEAMDIIGFMVQDKQLDRDICNLLVESGLVVQYARQHLPSRQIDSFTWCGKKYDPKSAPGCQRQPE